MVQDVRDVKTHAINANVPDVDSRSGSVFSEGDIDNTLTEELQKAQDNLLENFNKKEIELKDAQK